jgi:hypothetical protein
MSDEFSLVCFLEHCGSYQAKLAGFCSVSGGNCQFKAWLPDPFCPGRKTMNLMRSFQAHSTVQRAASKLAGWVLDVDVGQQTSVHNAGDWRIFSSRR